MDHNHHHHHVRNKRGKSIVAVQERPQGSIGKSSDELKMMYREIERQRRQEMASLYSSLRSLLPPGFVKSKGSISDHMGEAVNYITHLQKKIKQMELKKESLKKLINCSGADGSRSRNRRLPSRSVTVSPCSRGVEVSTISGSEDTGVLLSSILQVLVNQHGLEVVSSLSTQANGKLFHTIRLQVINDAIYVDRLVLQQLLTRVIDGGQAC